MYNNLDLKELLEKVERAIRSKNYGPTVLFQLRESLQSLITKGSDNVKHQDFGITKREIEVMEYLVGGFTNKEIASALNLSSKTVEFHLSSIYSKIDCSNRSESIAFIIKNKLVEVAD